MNNSLKVKLLSADAKAPVSTYDTDAGYDVVATTDGVWNKDGSYVEYGTGIAVEVPEGYHVELFPRSSVSKYDLVLANSIGLVDAGYRNEIKFRYRFVPRFITDNGQLERDPANPHRRPTPVIYQKGDRIGQIVIRKTEKMPVEIVESLSETDRNLGGFGSSGK